MKENRALYKLSHWLSSDLFPSSVGASSPGNVKQCSFVCSTLL